ncbi:MAG: universal stress protein [Spirochaetes bacterium]|nr:universal stress protein [Spirochaetota bacterium]MBN2771743.1 universal stress protein [Spirochaetota bacterium]
MDNPVERVLVYLDGSIESVTAARYAICLCRKLNAKLYGTFIINTHALNDLVKSRIFIESEQIEYKNDLEADADKYLRNFETEAVSKGLAPECIKESGLVNVKIKELVRSYEIDLFVIGELSRIRSRRDEFHNESERAMRSVPCSVLIVKDEDRVDDIYENLN